MINSEKSIGFLNADQAGGCGFYRSFLPFTELRLKGWDAVYGIPSYLEDHGLACKSQEKDEFLCGFEVAALKLIFDKNFLEYIDITKKAGQKIVSDIDDFYPGLNDDNIAYHSTDPQNNPESNRDHLQEIWMKSDGLTVSTQFLYDYYSQKHNNVHLIRNGIDINRYRFRHDTAGITPTIGWVGGIPWRTRDLETLQPIMNKFLKKNGCWFHHVGSIDDGKQIEELINIDKNIVTKKPLVSLAMYPLMFTDFDIGVVPLSKNDFNEAKSFIKGLEYVASGIPFVAADSYEYQYLHSFGIGRIASNEDEWEKNLTELLDPQVRLTEAKNNWKRVNESFTIKKRGLEWHNTMSLFYDH